MEAVAADAHPGRTEASATVRVRRRQHRELRPFGILRESPAFHFYLLQLIGFAYVFYRFASRNYTVYGLLPDDAFDYPRTYLNEFLPVPLLHFTTFQFLYDFLPRPSPAVLHGLQVTILCAAGAGLLGILSRLCAIVCFLLGTHITGMMQASNADVDGGTLALCTLLILALAPRRSFYGWRTGFHPGRRSVDHHWPIFLLFLVVGSYYTAAGLNKWIEEGFAWPWRLHLENLAALGVEQSLFVGQRFRVPALARAHQEEWMSIAGGIVSLVGEIGFLSILFLPRFRLFFVVTMIVMHVLVFALQGINFLGSSIILLLCVDWNAPVRRGRVFYDERCGFCVRVVRVLRSLDWTRRLTFHPIGSPETVAAGLDPVRLVDEMGFADENGELYYGADAVEQVAIREPLLWPFALFLRIPGAIYPTRWVYGIVAKNRTALGCSPDGSCELPR